MYILYQFTIQLLDTIIMYEFLITVNEIHIIYTSFSCS